MNTDSHEAMIVVLISDKTDFKEKNQENEEHQVIKHQDILKN